MTRPVKTCACGRSYSRETWARLPLVGEMPDGDGGTLILRDCVCRSTIAVDAKDLIDSHEITPRDREAGARAAAEYLAIARPWWRKFFDSFVGAS